MKSTVFWVLMSCSSESPSPSFRRNIPSQSSGLKSKASKKPAEAGKLSLPPVYTGFLLGLLFNPEDGSDMFSPKGRLTFSGLHDVIS
jgi:hypothetical protein